MVWCRETQAPTNSPPSVKGKEPVKELVTETSCVIDADADIDDTEMTDSDVAEAGGLTAPPGRQRVNEEGKKPLPSSQHRSSPDRNYSQADSEKLQAVISSAGDYRSINRIVHQPGQPLHRRHIATPAMGPGTASASASAEAGMDVDCDEAHDEVLQSGREIPRYEHENLDSSPDYGRRDGAQRNSRHICKVCSREFPSGRALGGHMRAHGNGDPGTSTTTVQQLNPTSSSSPREASQIATNAEQINGSSYEQHPHPSNGHDTKPLVVRPESQSPDSRARARNQREIQSRRTAGARRSSTTNGKARHRESTITPKSSVEDAVAGKQEHHDDDDYGASNREHVSEPTPSSSSSSDDGISEGANDDEDGAATDDAAANVCDVCREEFENGKQLHIHKKSHEVYALRSNPKRSRRFIDQDYTECAPSTLPSKKQITPHDKHDCPCPYPDCPKRFHSWKALFGHMRCHPDRTWRGIHPPTDENGASTSAAGERQHRRKKVRPNSNAGSTSRAAAAREAAVAVAATSTSESEPEAEPVPESKQSGKSPVSEEIESDTESIEAAYMNGDAYLTGDRHQSTSTPGWWASGVTGKRSKRSRQSVRSMQAGYVGSAGASTSTANASTPPSDTAMEELNETALVMMMLASNGTGIKQEVDLDELRKGVELSLNTNIRRGAEPSMSTHHGQNSSAGPHREEERAAGGKEDEEVQEEEVVEELSSGRELTEDAADIAPTNDADEWKLMEVDEESFSEEGEGGGDEKDAGQLEEASTSKVPKYQCNTCKRSFRSHQALGGHRASHKKVKGCFARTNVGDNHQLESHDEETSEELLRSEEQLPTELNDLSHSEGDDKDRQLTSASRDESSTEILVHPVAAGANSKKGAHRCTECGRCFDSGQALGGHKRCHFDPTKKDGDKENSSSNNGGKNQRLSNPGGRVNTSQSRGRHEGIEGRGQSPRARSDLGLSLQAAVGQQAAAAGVESSWTTTTGERAHSAQVLRPIKPIDLNLPAPVNDEEDDEMPPTAFSPSAGGSQIENQEPKSVAEESSPTDGELAGGHIEYTFAALLPPLPYQPFECSMCGQRCFSHDALTQHAATQHKRVDQSAIGSFMKRMMS